MPESIAQFSNKIQNPDGRLIEFSFYYSNTEFGKRYFIKVIIDEKAQYNFKMKKDNKSWIIIGNSDLPEWIWNIESKLSEVICNYKS